MPSPVGHSLAAVALSGLGRRWFGPSASSTPGAVPGRRRVFARELTLLGGLIFAANAPDLDFVPGILIGDPDRFHHGPSHSLGAALLFGIICTLAARAFRVRRPIRFGLLMTIAFISHLVLDMFSIDRRPPAGVPLLWPFSQHYFVVPIALFLDIKRNRDAGNFFSSLLVSHNLIAMAWEFVVMGLVLAVMRAIVIVNALVHGRSQSAGAEAHASDLG